MHYAIVSYLEVLTMKITNICLLIIWISVRLIGDSSGNKPPYKTSVFMFNDKLFYQIIFKLLTCQYFLLFFYSIQKLIVLNYCIFSIVSVLVSLGNVLLSVKQFITSNLITFLI